MSAEPKRQFNFIFSKLVEKSDDLVGLLAYGIYKQEKIHFIERFKTENNDRNPTEEDLKLFHDLSNDRIDQYRQLALNDLAEIQNEVLSERVHDIRIEFERRLKDDLAQAKTSWWAAITQSFLGSVVFTFFLGFLLIILLGAKYGLNRVLEEGVKMLTGT
ncbi:hypothetical protein [Desulfovibrio inopinatus]|uniref:hypothetical protein n=1 Tax=Desulfovibrio inopinatus TaxID=102109 RepID=UPI000421FBAF|nr:hypothetical protein [Desulfovibrio inopinatus]